MQEIQYALIKNNTVENIIVADENFIKIIQHEWDSIVCLNDISIRVGIGWGYENEAFIAPILNEIVEE